MTRSHEEVFEVALPRDRVWAVMADTQHLNQLLFGLQAGKVVGRDGAKVRLRGTFGMFAPEYDEYPWSFDVPRHYKNVRVFTKGALLDRLETECRIEDGENGRTRVRYALKVAGKGVFADVAARIVIRRMRRGVGAARLVLDKMARGSAAALLVQWPPANPHREAVLARAGVFAEALAPGLTAIEKQALDQLLLHIADGTDADIARLRPYVLADGWALSRKATLEVFLRAARAGLLRLSWDVLCPSCEGATTVESLKDLPDGGHCPACDIDFATSFENNVEATFRPEPQVRQGERLVFCHGSPATTKHWLAQFVVEAKASHELKLNIGVGRYRLQAQSVQRPSLVDVVQEGGAAKVHVQLGRDDVGLRFPPNVPPLAVGDITLVIENTDDKAHRVQFAHRAFASQAATAADVVALPLFRELFGRDVLAPDQHVGVGQMAILFTDLVGSTALYERLGDSGAYALVREHFKLLFRAVENHHGRIVKTVGDCVMASFDLPADAARAGFDCIQALRALTDRDGNQPGLRLKVGVHTGSCLAIEANNNVDYFGRTVNIAARVEALAAPDELVLSWAMLAAPDVKSIVDEFALQGNAVRTDQQKVKGIDGDVCVIRIAVKT